MNALAGADRERLTRLLGMLGSDFDGEVANAGRLADRLVRAAGLTWPEIIAAPTLPPPDREPSDDPLRGNWRRSVAACMRFPYLLSPWEQQFISGLQRFPRLSPKQRTILVRIVERLRAAGCSL